jgi:hypothetical protein
MKYSWRESMVSVCPLNLSGAGSAIVPTGPDAATALPVVTLVPATALPAVGAFVAALVAALVVAAAVPETALPLVAARVAAVVGAAVAVGLLLPPQAARMADAALTATPPIKTRRVSFASRARRSSICVTLPASLIFCTLRRDSTSVKDAR